MQNWGKNRPLQGRNKENQGGSVAQTKKLKLKSDKPSRRRLIKKLDAVFSKRIRARDKWICQRCRKQHKKNSQGLHCSHYWHRADMGTRWEDDNCIALCYGCHRRWEGDKQGEYLDFMMDKLGEQRYNCLKVRAKGIVKFSVSDLEILLKDLQCPD